jgi:hypothetical protein
MIFGGPYRDTINPTEFKRALGSLSNMSAKERGFVEVLFMGDALEDSSSERGIDKKEYLQKIKWLKEHRSKHYLSDRDIAEVEKEFSRFFSNQEGLET